MASQSSNIHINNNLNHSGNLKQISHNNNINLNNMPSFHLNKAYVNTNNITFGSNIGSFERSVCYALDKMDYDDILIIGNDYNKAINQTIAGCNSGDLYVKKLYFLNCNKIQGDLVFFRNLDEGFHVINTTHSKIKINDKIMKFRESQRFSLNDITQIEIDYKFKFNIKNEKGNIGQAKNRVKITSIMQDDQIKSKRSMAEILRVCYGDNYVSSEGDLYDNKSDLTEIVSINNIDKTELIPVEQDLNNDYIDDFVFTQTKYSDVGGLNKVIQKVRESIEFPLKYPEVYDHMGIKPPKGILFYGPPGCGKTLLAQAIAGETNARFIEISAPEILSKWVGESEERLREIFEKARNNQPSIIFIDEIDAIAKKRSGSEVSRHDDKLVNQLLTLMDGFNKEQKICIIAATNRKELLDDAVLRPGRFDYHIEIPEPDEQGCFDILNINLKNKPVIDGFDTQEFAKKLHEYKLTGADIAFIVNEAAFNCLRNSNIFDKLQNNSQNVDYKALKINKNHFEKALNSLLEQKKINNSPSVAPDHLYI